MMSDITRHHDSGILPGLEAGGNNYRQNGQRFYSRDVVGRPWGSGQGSAGLPHSEVLLWLLCGEISQHELKR